MTVVLRAFAPIRAGEQVTIAYVGLDSPRAARREELRRNYKFECMCKACNQREKDACHLSDFYRVQLHGLRSPEAGVADEAAFEKWLADGAPTQYVHSNALPTNLTQMLEMIDNLNGHSRAVYAYCIMQYEGLFPVGLWEPVLARLVIASSLLENEDEVRKYALLAALLKQAETGSDGGWGAVVTSPRQTDWWGKRLKN